MNQQDSHSQLTTPPTLTPDAIQRVREGLAAARDRAVRHSIENALNQVAAITQEETERRVNGRIRRSVLRSLIHACFRVRVESSDYIPHEPAILAANHLNHIDPFLLLAEMPAQPYYYILGDARTLYNQGWKRQILRPSGGVIPLARWWKEEKAIIAAAKEGRDDLVDLATAIEQDVPSGGDVQTLRQIDRVIQAILTRGDGLILFPEGRLGSTEGKLHLPLKRGIAIYAIRAGVPIVPVAIIGTQDLYLGKELTLRFGQPLRFPQVNRPKRQHVETALEALQNALMALLPVNYQEPTGVKLFRYFFNHMLC